MKKVWITKYLQPLTIFKIGFFLGMTLILVILGVVAGQYAQLPLSWQLALRLYRGPALVILFFFLIGGNMYMAGRHLVGGMLAVVWGVGIIFFLFSPFLGIPLLIHPLWMCALMLLYLLNPLPVLHHQSRRWLLKMSFRVVTAPFHHVDFADSWMADQFNSLSLVLVDMQYLICFYIQEVDWTGANAFREPKMVTPCGDVRVLQCPVPNDGSYGNPCTSMNSSSVLSCKPIDRCYNDQYPVDHIIVALPALWRCIQCLRGYRDTRKAFPHVVNAFKYITSCIVIIFSALNIWYNVHYINSPEYKSETQKEDDDVLSAGIWLHMATENPFFCMWVVAAIINTLYTYSWDVKMDWGLLERSPRGKKLLRDHLLYRYKSFYYFAMVEDLVLRLTWTLTVTVSKTKFIDSEMLRTLIAILEIVRRFIWNFLRVELEHVNRFMEPVDSVDTELSQQTSSSKSLGAEEEKIDKESRDVRHRWNVAM